ncbi:MAG TPA: heterodisulfide reductase-related iron-sulfur binding cluster, partial [Candidatus Nitrosotenuis sp.]|nr:heterodisulfide reductase-related iron-sulfur binding cluster [Candidatus Nitrosotenuis sp.]
TRGRARLLFEMLQGDPLRGGWRDEHVKEALDLCLSCKGCKGECPVGVDMATYKAEFLSHYYAGRLRPPSAYAFGLIMYWARLAALAPALANAATQTPGLAAALKRVAGMAPERRVPAFAPFTFRDWFRRRGERNAGRPRLILWPDTFNNAFHPGTAIAAVEVLEAAGYQVILAPHTCCGRPMISKGLVEPARRRARRNIELLLPLAEGGIPVVGLEPSCILSLRDEYLALVPGEATRKVASVCLTFEELLAGRDLPLRPRPGPILVHGHCHQKALVGSAPTLELLRRLPGAEVREVDSGCCGMAGAFGYEAEHYEISEAIGRRRLIPAARQAAQEGATVVAAGTSCRQQLADLARVRALHPAEILAQSLEV